MFVSLQIVKAVCAQQNVCLPLQRFAKRVTTLRHHVVEHTPSRENINSTCLKGTRRVKRTEVKLKHI